MQGGKSKINITRTRRVVVEIIFKLHIIFNSTLFNTIYPRLPRLVSVPKYIRYLIFKKQIPKPTYAK